MKEIIKESCWKCKGSKIDEDGEPGCAVCGIQNINNTKQKN